MNHEEGGKAEEKRLTQRLVSSKSETKYASLASWRAKMAVD
jgi:hypothetical protein